jgi:predicted dehydrogenase
MKNKMKVAIIGLGHQTIEDHLPAVLASTDVELIGVVESNEQTLAKFLKENKEIPGYINLGELFKKEKPDFIIVAVPHNCHYEVTKQAIENGVHVLKEKPFAISLGQARELNKLASENNVKVSVTLQRRFNPIYSTFFQLIDKIGEPFYIDAKYTFFTDKPHDGWRGKKELAGGGCLIDMGYHMIDLLMWYFGLPDKIFSELSSEAKEGISYNAEDTTQVTFRYDEKKLWGNLLVSRVIPPKQEQLNVYGTRGIIHIERGKIEKYSCDGELQESLERKNSWPSAAQDQLECFVKVIKGEKENINNPEKHYNHLAFIEAAYKSKNTGMYVNPKELLKL